MALLDVNGGEAKGRGLDWLLQRGTTKLVVPAVPAAWDLQF